MDDESKLTGEELSLAVTESTARPLMKLQEATIEHEQMTEALQAVFGQEIDGPLGTRASEVLAWLARTAPKEAK